MKFSKPQLEVLSEIYRRLNYFHSGNLNERLLLLAKPSFARPAIDLGLIEPVGREIPRALNWYNLTDRGKAFFGNYVTKRKLSERINSEIFTRERTIKFKWSDYETTQL